MALFLDFCAVGFSHAGSYFSKFHGVQITIRSRTLQQLELNLNGGAGDVLTSYLGGGTGATGGQQPSPSVALADAPQPSPPSSVPLVQPRFTPAPAIYSPFSVPTYSSVSQSSGPVSPATLSSAAPAGQCQTVGQVLASIPEVLRWYQLLQNAGLDAVLLNYPKAQATVLVPINSAFDAQIDAMPLRPEHSMAELIQNAPDLVSPLAGYSVLKGLWPSSTLRAGAILPTSSTIDKVNPLTIQALGQGQLQGIGSSATILQADISACGPSVIHIIDQILLPFKFDQGATDAIVATRGYSPSAYSAAG